MYMDIGYWLNTYTDTIIFLSSRIGDTAVPCASLVQSYNNRIRCYDLCCMDTGAEHGYDTDMDTSKSK